MVVRSRSLGKPNPGTRGTQRLEHRKGPRMKTKGKLSTFLSVELLYALAPRYKNGVSVSGDTTSTDEDIGHGDMSTDVRQILELDRNVSYI